MVPANDSCRLHPGDVINQKYRIVEELGVGGFGRVYAAQNLNLGTSVAIKVRHATGSGSPDNRLRREAQLAASLTSPYCVRVFDVDSLPDGTSFIVMELLEGETLRGYLKQRGNVGPALAVEWTLQICATLGEAHAMDLVHRDIKPSNLFVVRSNPRPHLKLVDFGLAKSLVNDSYETVTDSSLVIGSPAYMAPERIRSGTISASSDIWSVGVVLFEMLSGDLPFVANGKSAMLAAIAADPPRPLRDAAPHADPELGVIIARCLRKRPEDRYGSIDELADALRKFRGGEEPSADTERSRTISSTLEAVASSPTSSLKTRRWALAAVLISSSATLGWLGQRAFEGARQPAASADTQTRQANASSRPRSPDSKLEAARRNAAAPPAVASETVLTPPPERVHQLESRRPLPRLETSTPLTRAAARQEGRPTSTPAMSNTPGLFKEPDF